MKKAFVFLFLYALTAGIVLYAFTMRAEAEPDFRHSYAAMIDGTAYRPYVYRTLVPNIVRAIKQITPDAVKVRVNSLHLKQHTGRITRTCEMLGWDETRMFTYLVILLIHWACLIGFAFSMKGLIKALYDLPAFFYDFLPIIALLLLTLGLAYGMSIIYDPSTLLFMALGLLLIVKRRYALFYPVLLLAILNKETAFLLIVFFAVHEFRVMRPGKLAMHLAAQSVAFIAIQGLIKWHFSGSPGEVARYHLMDNLLRSSNISLAYIAFIFVVFGLPIRNSWRSAPVFLRRSFIAGMVFLIPGWLLFCRLAEVRDLLEIYPVVFLLIVPFITNLFAAKSEV